MDGYNGDITRMDTERSNAGNCPPPVYKKVGIKGGFENKNRLMTFFGLLLINFPPLPVQDYCICH